MFICGVHEIKGVHSHESVVDFMNGCVLWYVCMQCNILCICNRIQWPWPWCKYCTRMDDHLLEEIRRHQWTDQQRWYHRTTARLADDRDFIRIATEIVYIIFYPFQCQQNVQHTSIARNVSGFCWQKSYKNKTLSPLLYTTRSVWKFTLIQFT